MIEPAQCHAEIEALTAQIGQLREQMAELQERLKAELAQLLQASAAGQSRQAWRGSVRSHPMQADQITMILIGSVHKPKPALLSPRTRTQTYWPGVKPSSSMCMLEVELVAWAQSVAGLPLPGMVCTS